MQHTQLLEKIKNSRCAVLGFGVSNRPLVEFLLELGAREITVHDKKPVAELDPSAADFEARGVRFVTGDGYLAEIRADVIFRSPGIRDDREGIAHAVENGAWLTSEMELFFALTPATVIGITDSAQSPLAECCDHVLLAKSDMVSLVDSLVAPLSVVNALIVAIAAKREKELARTFDTLERIWDEYEVDEKNEKAN